MGRDGGAGALRAHVASRRCAARSAPPACRSRWPATSVPLVRDPAALPLLDALRAVLNLDNDDPDHVDHIDPGRAEALLTRSARRARRRRRTPPRRGCCAPARRSRPRPRPAAAAHSRELVRARGASSRASSTGSRAPRSTGPAALAELAAAHARAAARRRARPPRSCSGRCGPAPAWPRRLRRSVELGGGAARRAHRDLDSICRALRGRPRAPRRPATTSASASSSPRWSPSRSPPTRWPSAGARGAAVRLLTAHRAKGLEWRLVVVAHVQQDGWPDLRRRVDAAAGRPDRRRRAGARRRPRASC